LRNATPRDAARSALVALVLLLVLATVASARPSDAIRKPPKPIPAPASLLKARAACPNTATIVECRGALRRALEAVEWQRSTRWRTKAAKIDEVTRDAIHWAAWKYGGGTEGRPCARCRALELQMLGLGRCESHLFLWATNGQYKSWAQLSGRHRSDPIIQRLTWRDPYAVADHVARYLIRHGEGEWQCVSTGGLRW